MTEKEKQPVAKKAGALRVEFEYGRSWMIIKAGGTLAIKELAEAIKAYVETHGPLEAIEQLKIDRF